MEWAPLIGFLTRVKTSLHAFVYLNIQIKVTFIHTSFSNLFKNKISQLQFRTNEDEPKDIKIKNET